MFEFQYFLTAGLTMIGFVSALPPRVLISYLKNRRSSKTGPRTAPAATGGRSSGREGSPT